MEKMNNERLHMALVDKLHQEHAFWSFDKTTIGNISDDVLIEKVLLHLDIDDIISLFRMYPRKMIQRIWKDTMLAQEPMYHGLNRLYAFLLFDIKNPDRYIRDFVNKRHKSMLCKG